MDGISELRPARTERGFVLVAVMALITVLLATSAAYMRWATDESLQSAESAAAMQAYYLGQMGIVERGFLWLRTQPAGQLPVEQPLPGRQVPGFGSYGTVNIRRLIGQEAGDFWAIQTRFRISAVGTVRIPVYREGRNGYEDVNRLAVLYVEVRNFADYMYLSDEEMTNFGDRIKFWHGDTLEGRVHSNSEIAIMQDPVFYEQVSTTECDFWRGTAYAPVFLGPDPLFRTAAVQIPQMAERLRQGAAAAGYFYSEVGMTHRAVFRGATVTFYKWPTGAPFDSTITWSVGLVPNMCVFVDGPLELKGTVTGQVTIGSAGTLRLLDDIKYSGNLRDGWYIPDTELRTNQNVLGIVSESEVKIANTRENGRENAAGLGLNQTNRNLADIVITAAVVALGESFTFENQNDPDSGYVFDSSPDDRGQIFLFGSITQMRRGYVHRSTNNSTGYLKKYKYDKRLLQRRPPCFFDVTDEHGHALFNVVQWGRGDPRDYELQFPLDVRDKNIVRYN
jgi:type II secretory pathway pseudopilin PulG